jgi:hypothetical protein
MQNDAEKMNSTITTTEPKLLKCEEPEFLALLKLWSYTFWDIDEVFPTTTINLVKLARKRWDIRPFIKKGEHLVKLNKKYGIMGTTNWGKSDKGGRIWYLREEGHLYLDALVENAKYNARGWSLMEESASRKKSQALLLICQGEKFMKIYPARDQKPVTDRRVARLFFEALVHPFWKEKEEEEKQPKTTIQKIPLITVDEKPPTRINLKEDLTQIKRFTGHIRCLYPGDEWEILRFQHLRPLEPGAQMWPLDARFPHIRIGVSLILQNLDANIPASNKMVALEAAVLKYIPWLYRREDITQIKDTKNGTYILLVRTPLVNVLHSGYFPHYVAICTDCLSSRCYHISSLQEDAYLDYSEIPKRKGSRKIVGEHLKISFSTDRFRVVDELHKIPFLVDETCIPKEVEEETYEAEAVDLSPEAPLEEDSFRETVLGKPKLWDNTKQE